MSALHTSLRLATREQHRRLDSHVLMMALMQPGLTAHVYAAALRGLGGALADCESAIEVAHHRYLTARHELARWRGEAGDAAGAAADYRGVLAGGWR